MPQANNNGASSDRTSAFQADGLFSGGTNLLFIHHQTQEVVVFLVRKGSVPLQFRVNCPDGIADRPYGSKVKQGRSLLLVETEPLANGALFQESRME